MLPEGSYLGETRSFCTDEMFGSAAVSEERVAGTWNEITHVFQPLRSPNITPEEEAQSPVQSVITTGHDGQLLIKCVDYYLCLMCLSDLSVIIEFRFFL